MTKCVHGCGRDLLPNSKLPDCQPCRGTVHYYKKKRPGQVIKRRRQLSVLTSRMDTHFDSAGHLNKKPVPQRTKPLPSPIGGNVVELRTRRRA